MKVKNCEKCNSFYDEEKTQICPVCGMSANNNAYSNMFNTVPTATIDTLDKSIVEEKIKIANDWKKGMIVSAIITAIAIILFNLKIAQVFMTFIIVLAVFILSLSIYNYFKLNEINKFTKECIKNGIDYKDIVLDIKYKPFKKKELYIGSKAMYIKGAIVQYKDIVWTYGKNIVQTTRFYGFKVGENNFKSAIFKSIKNKEYEIDLSTSEWLWFLSTYGNMFPHNLIIGYGNEQQAKYNYLINSYKTNNVIDLSYNMNNGTINYIGYNQATNNEKNRNSNSMNMKELLKVALICVAFFVVFMILITSCTSNNKSNKGNSVISADSKNKVGEIKKNDIIYNDKKVGIATEKQLENNKSLYTFEYKNLEDINVNISFEFESGFVNKMSKYYDYDMLTFYDNTRLIGIMNFGDIDVEYIEEYGKDRYFDDYLNTLKDRLGDVRLEYMNGKYVYYYKEKGSFTDEVNYQSIAIIDLNEGYGMDFSYAVSKDKVFDTSYLDLFIKTIKVND